MHLNTSTHGINYEPEMLPESSSAIFPKPSEEDALVRHKEFLEEIIDSDFGLLDKLLQTGTLSWREIADIKAKDTFYRRNYELLDLISEKNKYDCLISALIDTNQLHVVNYLNGDGEYRTEFGGCWPLMEKDISTLRANHGRLVEIIDPCDLVMRLFSAEVITSRQKEFISSRRSCTEQNEAMLEILRRRSFNDYRTAIDCLCQSNQSHVAELLVQGGVIVRIHASLDETLANVTEAEEEISSAFASTVSGKSLEEINRILQLTQFKCIAAKRGQSIVLYAYCGTVEELQQLREMLANGRLLRDSVELLFNRLLTRSQKIAVTIVTIYAEEFDKGEKYFQDSIEGRRTIGNHREDRRKSFATSSRTVNDLPLELLDIILRKSFLHFVLSGKQFSEHGDEFMINRLAAVDFCWFQRFKKRRFKKNIWSHLSEFYKAVDTAAAIIRINQPYLVENIQSNRLIKQLRSTDCLTDLQTRLVSRKNLDSDKTKLLPGNNNSDVWHIIRSVDNKRRSTFIGCLNRTSHRRIVEVIENGGVVTKATIRTEDSISRRSLEEELVTRMVDLRDGMKRRPSQTDRLIIDTKNEDVEMLHCQLDRQAAAWIWCRSQVGLEKLENMNGRHSRSLVDALKALSNSPSSIPQTIKPRTINIDNDQFRKTVVIRRIVVNFTTRLSVGKTEEVKGVTKLRNEVYALCRSISPSSPNVIRVFEDRNLFRLQKEIDLKDIKDPEDIGSSERENVLYVTDLGMKCVWKITREADDYPAIRKWSNSDLRWPYTLSVTNDGQLLMLSGGNPVSCLGIYGSDGELRHSIQLPTEIRTPLHAVQTSTQNFIIAHRRREEGEEGDEVEETNERDKDIWSVSEVSRNGQLVIRRLISEGQTQQLNNPCYISLDSGDRVFVADTMNNRVILLNSDLRWNRILCPTRDEGKIIFRSWRLFHDKEKNQLIVGGLNRGVNVYRLSRK